MHSRPGASLGQAGVQSTAVRVHAHCQGVPASLPALGVAGLGVRCISGTWTGRSRDTACRGVFLKLRVQERLGTQGLSLVRASEPFPGSFGG